MWIPVQVMKKWGLTIVILWVSDRLKIEDKNKEWEKQSIRGNNKKTSQKAGENKWTNIKNFGVHVAGG